MARDFKPPPPWKTWDWYRAHSTISIAKRALDDPSSAPAGVPPLEWTVYNALCALEDIVRAMGADTGSNGR